VENDRIAELERALRADSSGNVLAALILRSLAAPERIGELCHQLEMWANDLPLLASPSATASPGQRAEGERRPADVDEAELERAFDAAEPELESMITPDSIAEEAALRADATPEPHSPLASSGAFATRTMAELLERQGDRRGAARIRAALGESEAAEEQTMNNAAAIAALERWLENVRRLRP
jgi:hypothetical protein